MIQIKFKGLDKSEMTSETVNTRVTALVDKFPDLHESKISITLEMENSPLKAGPDLFKVKLHIARGRYDGITISKSDANIFVALAEVIDHMLEKLNRFGDRGRVKERNQAREINRESEQISELDDSKTE